MEIHEATLASESSQYRVVARIGDQAADHAGLAELAGAVRLSSVDELVSGLVRGGVLQNGPIVKWDCLVTRVVKVG